MLDELPDSVHAFALTQRGHGDADKPAHGYAPEDHAGDLLAFLDGRLADNWVRTPEEIAPRLARLDPGRDPDLRYRVNELYCRDETWRPTLEALLDVTDTVLMDLRSFRAQNAGCIFELEQLVRRVSTDDIVLVCDRTTDLPLLRGVMGAAWTNARNDGGGARQRRDRADTHGSPVAARGHGADEPPDRWRRPAAGARGCRPAACGDARVERSRKNHSQPAWPQTGTNRRPQPLV
jgi:hypothetical protein